MKITEIIQKEFTEFIYNRQRKSFFSIISPLLYIVSRIVVFISTIRLTVYKIGVLKSKSLQARVISVGNVTVGGTGKTPMVEMIARRLQEENCNVAILSRGYKGKSQEEITVVSTKEEVLEGADFAGDEPYMMAKNLLGVPVITGKKRYQTGRYAIDRFGVDCLILDDGYQHIQLNRDVNILLIDSQVGFASGGLFPLGILRESLRGINRADCIVFTKCTDEFDPEQFRKQYSDVIPDSLPVFTSQILPGELEEIHSGKKEVPAGYLSGKKIVAFCAIASPDSFRSLIEQAGGELVELIEYPDHYFYTEDDLFFIERKREEKEADLIVTTRKDEVKIKGFLSFSFPLWVFQIQIKIDDAQEADFIRIVLGK